MQRLEEVCNLILVSQDNERIRAQKVVLASVSISSGTCCRLMTRIHIMEHNGESMVKERYCEDFLKINIFKVKSTDSYKGKIL